MLLFIAVFCLLSSNYLHVQTILVPSIIKIMNCYFIRVRQKKTSNGIVIRLLFLNSSFVPSSFDPSFIPRSAFYPLICLLSLIRLLSPHPPFISLSAFYPLMRRLNKSSYPPSVSAFYPDPYSTVRATYS